MTHRLRRVFQWAVSLLLACLVTPVHGTHFVISSLVATDASSGSATDGIRELELYRQGLFWTVPTLSGGVEFSHQGSAGILSYRLGPISTPFYPQLGGPTIAFATRDDAFIYYTGPDGVHRKLLNASSSDAGLTIGGSWNVNEPGATMIYNDRVYYSVGNSNPSGNDGYLSIEYFSAPGAQGTFEPIFQVANGPNLASDPGPVIKMGVAYRRLAGVSGLVPYGVALTAQGLLLRFELEYNQFMVSSVGILATDVSDFAIRREQFFDNSPVHLPYYQDALYATIGRFQCAGDPRAKIATVDPLLGTQSTVWTAPDGARVLSLGLDDKYLFVSTIQATASGGLGCRTVGDGVIRAKLAPAFFTIGDNSSDPNWDPIEFNAGYNLRSDGQTLYFTYGQQIRQMPNNSPRIRLDIASAGLEAIQTVQDFNNSVPLVPGKYTLVRGYAKILDNTKGLNNLELTASLRAFRNGVELPGSPIFAGNRPTIDTLGDLPTLRTNLARSFNFEVPANWLVPGTLKLRYTVNPFASVPENADALANNSSEANLTVVPGRQPALVFKSMSSTHPNYDPESSSSGFAEIIDRAESLMPVSGFKIYFSDGSVTKPVMTFSGVKGRSFSMPDDRNWALVWMSVAHMFSDDPTPDTHWIGTLPTEDAPFNGIGGARGVKLSDLTDGFSVDFTIPHTALDNTAVVRMSANQGNSTNAWGSVVGGHTLAHELGHNYGRFHIRQTPSCGAQAPARPWQVYPFDPCTLGQPDLNDPTAPVGFDRRTRTLVAPGAAGDLMSYADSDWTSPFTWNALVAAIPVTAVEGLTGVNQVTRVRTKDDINPQPLPPHDPAFIWQGVISPDSDTATLVPGFRLPRGTIDPRKVKDSLDAAAQLPLNARFRLRLIGDVNATPLDERPVHFVAAAEGDGASLAFVQAMPDIGTATKVQILSGTRIIAEMSASPNSPIVTLGTPIIDLPSHTLTMVWASSDADNDPLLFTVQFSPDNGTNWTTLKVNDPDPALAISTAHLPGGDQCILRVIATDGFNTTLAATDPFVLPRLGPSITVSGLVEGQRIPFGARQPIRIFAYDAEDGSLGFDSLSWSVSGGLNQNGTGREPQLNDLPPGPCVLAATATDSDGNVAHATVHFEVLPVAVPEAPAPTLDGIGADEGYFLAPVIRLQTGSAEPLAQVIHQNGFLYVSFNGLPVSDPGAPPATVQIGIDTTAAGDPKPQNGDVAFGVNQDGLPTQTRGQGSDYVAEAMDFDFHAVISRTGSAWGAEMAIPDRLVGGWNHDARIAIQFLPWRSLPNPSGVPIIIPGTMLTWPYAADFASPSTYAAFAFGGTATPPPNRAPVAVPRAPTVVALAETRLVALDGAGSFDPDADPLTFTWTQVSGPTVELSGAATATPTFSATVPAVTVELVFQLVVNDGLLDSDPAQVRITLAPIAAPETGGGIGPVSVGGIDGTASGQLEWPGAAGAVVTVQASTDLANWIDIQTNSIGFLQALVFGDADAGAYPQRFYRLHDWTAPAEPAGVTALQFSGTDSLVTVPHSASLNALPLTIMAWLNTTQSTGSFPGIISKYEGGQSRGYALGMANGRFDPWYYADPGNHVQELSGPELDGRFVADGLWHHVAYVVGTDAAQIYIDGVLVNDLPWLGTAAATTTESPLLFGAYRGGSALPYDGLLEEVSIWNRALPEEEIRALMYHPAKGTENGLQGLWHFNETEGTTAADSSGSGNDGSLSGPVSRVISTAPLH